MGYTSAMGYFWTGFLFGTFTTLARALFAMDSGALIAAPVLGLVCGVAAALVGTARDSWQARRRQP